MREIVIEQMMWIKLAFLYMNKSVSTLNRSRGSFPVFVRVFSAYKNIDRDPLGSIVIRLKTLEGLFIG
jgi:hypothetical protein